MDIPEALIPTDQEREWIRNKRAYISNPAGASRISVQFSNHEVYGSELLAGGYEQVLQYLMSLYPAQPGCQQVSKDFSHHHQRLLVYKKPYYVGENLDEAAALIHKFKRLHVANSDLFAKLRTQFPFLECMGNDQLAYVSKVAKKRTLRRLKESRVRKGLVPNRDVTNLYWRVENDLHILMRGVVEIRGWCWPRTTGGYMERIPKLVSFSEKVGIYPPKKMLRGMEKYIPGLLKHPDKDYRNFGEWLKKKLKGRKR